MDLEKLMILFDNPSEMDVMRFTLIYICSNLTPPPPPNNKGMLCGSPAKEALHEITIDFSHLLLE